MQSSSKWYNIRDAAIETAGYYLWRHINGVWQVTRTDRPPTNDAGYYNRLALMKLKGI